MGLLLGFIATACVLLVDEIRSSRWQARFLSGLGSELAYPVQPGPSPSIRFPGAGPFDERLGYSHMPQRLARLTEQGYQIESQARPSARMVSLHDLGLFDIYPEKSNAGLDLLDCRAEPLASQRVPERVYADFHAVPRLLVDTLLFIENRELLDPSQAKKNPAVEWDRLARAVLDRVRRKFDDGGTASGGSTLATQIEKFRHSPDGRTDSPEEKLRQMASASLRAYADGPNTMPRRRQIVVDYLNTVPLVAQAGFGEVHGMGDGLWAWYGRDFSEVNRALTGGDRDSDIPLADQALAFKQALSLMIAQRRPAYYLDEGEADLGRLANSYLRLLAASGVITTALRDAALPLNTPLLVRAPSRPARSFVDRKALNALRNRLAGQLGIARAYDLDRLDLVANSTLDSHMQRAAAQLIASLRQPGGAQAAGLYGQHLLRPKDDLSHISLSFTLYERTEQANVLRVQTDNLDQPFDINEGARLDLGSTAKLRTLVTYLQLVAERQQSWAALDAAALAALDIPSKDLLSRWARDYLLQTTDRALEPMLDAAMQRRFSAHPGESFFTGGGLHTFENFDPEDNGRVMTVFEALQRSNNLVFIRLMREVVLTLQYQHAEANARLLDDPADPRRRAYLERFADKEGREFLARFYAKYRSKDAQEAEALLLQGLLGPRSSRQRLASAYFMLEPTGNAAGLTSFLAKYMPQPEGAASPPPVKGAEASGSSATEASDQQLVDRFGPGRLTLADRGYLARVHPLELWLVAYLRAQPKATWAEVVAASAQQRQEVYGWLFRTRFKSAQDSRLRVLLEQEAFKDLQRRWKQVGYPFDELTPSYATALGASGDRPAALAELMGIIVNEGLRKPLLRLPSLQFAADTPYETTLAFKPKAAAEQVLQPEVARVLRRALINVVDNGTARRLKGSLLDAQGRALPMGGKTGTGDHRFDTYGKGGQLIASRVVNRSATLVFLIGDRWFGTMMAYAHEPYAANYSFTSALPSQLLKALTPALQPMMNAAACELGAEVPVAP